MRFKVMNLDGQVDSSGEIIQPDGVEISKEPIPVTLNFSDQIRDVFGYATLEKCDGALYANLELVGDWKQDEASVKLLIPAVGGVCTGREGNLITKCEIRRIGLSISPNADRRIRPIGEQG